MRTTAAAPLRFAMIETRIPSSHPIRRITRPVLCLGLAALLLAGLTASASAALSADELAMVINKNNPRSRELAEYYAQLRHVPAGRIIELDLPDAEEIPFATYQQAVAPQVRAFLADHKLQDKVRCLVTFYGVPLRVLDRQTNPGERAEVVSLRQELDATRKKLQPIVAEAEALAGEVDSSFSPLRSDQPEALLPRFESAVRFMLPRVNALTAATKKAGFVERIKAMQTQINQPLERGGGGGGAERGAGRGGDGGDGGAGAEPDLAGSENDAAPVPTDPAAAAAEARRLQTQKDDPAARARLRQIVRGTFGLFASASVLNEQVNYLSSEESGSALDSELALLLWPDYSYSKWLANPRNPRNRFPGAPPVMMVMRLDAPDADRVKSMISDGIAVEKAGLSGKVVIDSRGIAPKKPDGSPDGFGVYDQYLRDAAVYLKQNSNLPLVVDDRPAVFLPGSVQDVAVYCGWYSVGNYVPSFTFAKGAVGYHVASFELLSMHDPNAKGWVPNMIKAGTDATLGAVAEPYLHAFPRPDDFLPLLMCGKLTLAEVYWDTTPLVSWKISMIGDPLYTPFAKAPAVTVQSLPEAVKGLVEK